MKKDRSFWICLIVLLTVLAGLQLVGQRALKRHYVRIDAHDETAYMNSMQTAWMLERSNGLAAQMWEVLHSFKSGQQLAKEPGTRLVSLPLVILQGGADPDKLRHYSFLWLIPSAMILYLGLTLLIRPLPALAGALIFCLSHCTLATFLHWYQEITAIPAVCALIWAVAYEARFGNRDNLGWIFMGVVVGAGFLTKISFIFIAIWLCGSLFVLSGWLDKPKIRRERLLKAALLAYIPASFWWTAHFPYAFKYYAEGPSFMMHGTLGRGFEHFSMLVRTHFSYMYGFWGSLLLIVAAGATVAVLIRRIRAKNVQINSSVTIVFFALAVILIVLYFEQYRGNCMNPRQSSVMIPLAAAAFAVAYDRILRGRYIAIQAGVFAVLIIQGISIFVPDIRPDWKQDKRWVQPFYKNPVTQADYSWLPSVAPLPEYGANLKLGYIGNGGTFSPHLIARGYYPDVHRVEMVKLVHCDATKFSTPLPEVSAVLKSARTVDYVVIARFREWPGSEVRLEKLERLAGLYFEKENSLNNELVEAFRQDAGFVGPEILIAESGKDPDLIVFRNVRPEIK